MKEQLIQHRDGLIEKGHTNWAASWFAVRDTAFDNRNFHNFVCRVFKIDHVTDLTQSQAVKLIDNIKDK